MLWVSLWCGMVSGVHAASLTIAAASDLKFAMDEVVRAFARAQPKHQVNVVYGSSGKFLAQIQQAAPFDMFFSADIAYPQALVQAGLAASDVQPYAVGRLVIWSASMDASKMTLNALLDPHIKRIAIANPQHAPYGKRAQEALQAAGIWTQVQHKLVYGENIAATAQYVQTGNAQVGLIALSLALSPVLAQQGGHALVDARLHEPLEQGFVITQRAAANPAARSFAAFMASPAARSIMNRHGFVLPQKKVGG